MREPPDTPHLLPVTEVTFSNGLTVLLAENHAAPVATCWVGYRVGVRNERPGITGASHWVEHMTFKGTERLPKGELFRRVSRYGGTNNGFTSDDFTIYYETLPSEHLEVALEIESQRMAFALFEAEETERERTVILAERDGAENHPHYHLGERMGEAVFHQHPYRWPVLGTRADLERMTHTDLLGHYRTYYTPGNAVLVVVGAFQTESLLAQVRHWFEGIVPGGPVPHGPPPEPEQREERRVEVRDPGPSAYLSLAYRAPAWGHADVYPLAFLDAILSGGKSVSWSGGGFMGRSSRVYLALVESRMAINAGTGYRAAVDPAAFSASLTLRPGQEPTAAEAALEAVLEGIAADPPSAEEMARALRQAEAQFAYGRDGVTSQAYALLNFQLHGHWSDVNRHLDRLRAVTRDDLIRVASAYLRPETRTAGWFIPS